MQFHSCESFTLCHKKTKECETLFKSPSHTRNRGFNRSPTNDRLLRNWGVSVDWVHELCCLALCIVLLNCYCFLLLCCTGRLAAGICLLMLFAGWSALLLLIVQFVCWLLLHACVLYFVLLFLVMHPCIICPLFSGCCRILCFCTPVSVLISSVIRGLGSFTLV